MLVALVVVGAFVIGVFTRLITRLAVTELWPRTLLVVMTRTFVPAWKSDTVAGLALVPYRVVGVIVTCTVLPSALSTVQMEPDIA